MKRLPIWTRDNFTRTISVYDFDDKTVFLLQEWDVVNRCDGKEFLYDGNKGNVILYYNRHQALLPYVSFEHFQMIVDEDLRQTNEPEPLKEGQMNKTTAIFLVDNNVKAIRASYDDTDNGKTTKTFKTLDTFEKDDLIVVPTNTRHGFTVCKVTEVDVEIDFDSSEDVKWVVCKVEKEQFEQIKDQEQIALTRIQKAQVNQKKKDLLDALKLDPTTIPTLMLPSNSQATGTAN